MIDPAALFSVTRRVALVTDSSGSIDRMIATGLASAAAAYVTGTVIPLEGGMSL